MLWLSWIGRLERLHSDVIKFVTSMSAMKWLCTRFLGRSPSEVHNNACKVAPATGRNKPQVGAWRNPHKVSTSVVLTLAGSDVLVDTLHCLRNVFDILTRAVESESREVRKSLKIGKNRIKLEKSDLISYPTFWQKCQNAINCHKKPKCLHFGSGSCIRIS